MMRSAGGKYLAYMIRMRMADGAQPAWRVSLEEVPTGERYPFASLEDALAYLRAQTALAEERDDGDVESPGERESQP